MASEIETIVELSKSDMIGMSGAIASVVIGVLSWFVSASHVRKTMQRKELQYSMRVLPLVNKKLFKETDKLEIKYKDDIIDELVLLEVNIINSGNVSIENPPIKIESKDATYIIPAYIEDVPDGYDEHWEIEREDGETSLIKVSHINPGQIIKARFLMDKMPPKNPMFICAMPDLNIKHISDIKISTTASKILEITYPNIASAVKLIAKIN